MTAMLEVLGVRTRAIALYTGTERGLRSHSYIEVFNPDAERWETQDADYNVYWRSRADGQRVDTEALLAGSRDAFEPCIDASRCGWHIVNEERMKLRTLEPYFAVASMQDKVAGQRPLMVNTARFDWQRRYPTNEGDATYCEQLGKNCRDDIRFFDTP